MLRGLVSHRRLNGNESESFMKRPMLIFCGLCWLAFGLVTAVFLWRYLACGAGLQESAANNLFFHPVSSGSVFIGLLHATGFFVLAVLCFLIGLGLCLFGIEPSDRDDSEEASPGGL